MSNTILETLIELSKRATPGPWRYCDYRIFNNFSDDGSYRVPIKVLAYTANNSATRTPEAEANGELMVALRSNLPLILASLEELDRLRFYVECADEDTQAALERYEEARAATDEAERAGAPHDRT